MLRGAYPSLLSPLVWHSEWKTWIWLVLHSYCRTPETGKATSNPCSRHRDLSGSPWDTWKEGERWKSVGLSRRKLLRLQVVLTISACHLHRQKTLSSSILRPSPLSCRKSCLLSKRRKTSELWSAKDKQMETESQSRSYGNCPMKSSRQSSHHFSSLIYQKLNVSIFFSPAQLIPVQMGHMHATRSPFNLPQIYISTRKPRHHLRNKATRHTELSEIRHAVVRYIDSTA